jgi:protein O-mannosyl-transferase
MRNRVEEILTEIEGMPERNTDISSHGRMIYLLAIAVILIITSHGRSAIWHDEVSLYLDAIGKSPNRARPYYQLGVYYQDVGDEESAESCYLQAASIQNIIDRSQASAFYNLGSIYVKQDNISLAIWAYTNAVKIDPNDKQAITQRDHLYYILQMGGH